MKRTRGCLAALSITSWRRRCGRAVSRRMNKKRERDAMRRPIQSILAVLPFAMLAACAGTGENPPAPSPAATYTPAPDTAPKPAGKTEVGTASYYGQEFAGKETASGE